MLSLGTMNIAADEGNESNASNTTTIKIPVSYTVVDETNSSDVVLEEDSPVEEVKSDVDAKTIVEDLTKDDSDVRSNLDPHQITAIKEGASTNIVLVVSDTNADEGEKTTVNNVIEQYSLKPAIMMDVDLLCTVTRNDIQVGDTQNITETKSEISVDVKVPDEYINTDSGINREYWIVRLHYSDTGLTTDVLPATFDSVTKMLTFKTNKFSLYAIAYKDTKVESEYVYIPSKNKKPVVNTAGYSFSPANIEISGNSAATVFNVDGLPESNVLDITYNTVLELKSANNETVSADVEFVDKITEDGSYTLNVKLQDTASKPALGKYEGNITVTIKNNEYEAKIGDKLYATLNGAIADSKDGDTIDILKDINENIDSISKIGFTINNKSVTLNGNNHTVTLNGSFNNNEYGIKVDGDVNKTVKINSLNINAIGVERAIRSEGNVNVFIENCKITTNGVGVHVKGDNKVDICNTTITVSVINNEVYKAHLRTAVMVGGVDADVTVNGCTINAINESKTDSTLTWCKGLYVGSTTNAKLSVNDTKVVADYSIAIDGSGTEGSPTQIIVNSGEFSGIIGSPSGYSYKEMTINGGVFAGLDNFDSFYGKDNAIAKLVISGGTFNIKPDAKFITDGYEVVENDGWYMPQRYYMWEGYVATQFSNIDETTKTININSAEELALFAKEVNNGNNYSGWTISLANDIDLSGKRWTPIGKSEKPFSGKFDGQSYTISNLEILTPGVCDVGLFGLTTNGSIMNVTIENAKVKGYLDVGVVSGTPYTSSYSNITVKGDIFVDGYAYVGGMFGKNLYANADTLTIEANEGSYVRANSENFRTYVGGIVGFMGEGSQKVSNVVTNIDVYGSTCDVGGVTGIAHYNNSFEEIQANCNVYITSYNDEGDQLEIGGIAGVWHNQNGTSVKFTNCQFNGEVKATHSSGTEFVGEFDNNGLIGRPYSTNGTGQLIIDSVVQS